MGFWCWLSGCWRLCWRIRVRGRWHFGSPAEVGIYSRVVAVDRVESSKLREVTDEEKEKKEKRVKGQNWRKEKQSVREKMPQHSFLSARHLWKQLTVLRGCGPSPALLAEEGPRAVAIWLACLVSGMISKPGGSA